MALCCCLGCLPLINGNPPATSDGFYHLLRAAEVARQLHAGIVYPRWAPDFYLGYGYPIFLFTPLLPYYLVLAVHALGPALQPATNIVEATALVASGLFAYAWLRRTFTTSGAAVGAVLYALAPYHLVNLYYRGDLSEFLAATCFPAILLALSVLLAAPTPRRAVMLGLAIAALLLTHFISALLFLPVVALLALAELRWLHPRMLGRQLLCGVAAAMLAAGLSAMSWLPAVTMSQDATFVKLLRFYNYAQNFAGVAQLFSRDPVQHYTAIFAGSQGFGYQFGLLQSLALAAGLVGWLLRRRWSDAATRAPVLVFAAVAALALAGCLRLAAPIWAAVPSLQLVQFPWRLLAIAALPAAYFAALAIDALGPRLRPAAGLAATGLIAASCLLLLNPPRIALPATFTTAAGIARFELLYHLAGTSAAAEYLPPLASQRQTTSAAAFALATGNAPSADPAADVANWTPSGRVEQFRLSRAKAGEAIVPILYFPGWAAMVDGKPATIHPAVLSGLIALPLAAGTHIVTVRLHEPSAARLGDVMSILALATVIGAIAADLALIIRRRTTRATVVPVGAAPRGRPVRQLPNLRKDSTTGLAQGPEQAQGPAPTGNETPFNPAFQRARNAVVILPVTAALLFAALGGRSVSTGWQALDVDLAGEIHLAGYALSDGSHGPAPEATVQPGQTVQLQVQGRSGSGRQLAVQLTDAAATDWADWQATIESGITTVRLPLPAALPPGLYELRLGAVATDGSTAFALQDVRLVRLLPVDGTLLLGPLVIPAPVSAAAVVGSPVARWPGQATLGDVSMPTMVRAGASFGPAWTWQAPTQPAGTRLTETVHLVDAAGHVLAAADTEPAGGYFPTPFWLPNELVRDHPLVRLAADMPPGQYTVRVGLRDGTGAVPAQDAAGRVVGDEATVGQVEVLPPAQTTGWDGRGITVGSLEVELTQSPGPATPGHNLTVSLRWHRTTSATPATTVTLKLSRDGQTFGSVTAPIGGATYPAARWRTGETESQIVDLPVSSSTPSGPADLGIAVSTNGSPVPALASLGTVTVDGRPHVYTAHPTTPTAFTFTNGIQLIGYDLRADGALWRQGAASAGSTLDVTLDWKGAGPTAQPLKVTVQLLSSDNHLLAQADTEPGNGAAPTTSWLAGEIVTSEHHLMLTGLPAGADHLIVALYDPKTNQRIQAAGADAVTLSAVTVQ